jgi:outer membrane cobalamin receptor
LLAEYSAEGGARGSATVQARAEAGDERFAWRVAGKYLTTDGVSAFNEDRGGRERDGYRNAGANVRGLYRFNDATPPPSCARPIATAARNSTAFPRPLSDSPTRASTVTPKSW